MIRFDFTKTEYEHFMVECPFTDEEKRIFLMRRKGKTTKYMSFELNISERTIKRRIKSINTKILKCLWSGTLLSLF